jgi:iron complex transport system substrate-binding protein
MKWRMTFFLVIFLAAVACSSNLVWIASAQAVFVPGDDNGDLQVSAEELKLAEDGYKDGKISSEELDTIRLIHESYPRTVTDSAGSEITIYKPIERIAVLTTEDYEILRTLNASDRVVAASKYVVQSKELGSGDLYSDGSGYANIGTPTSSVDWEALIKSNPDIVITYMTSPKQEDLDQNLKSTNITVMRFDSGNISQYETIIRNMGYLLDRNEEAEMYCSFFEEKLGKYLDEVNALSQDGKPKVYLEADFGGGQTYYTCGSGHAHNALILAAGGDNIFSNLEGFKQVDPESVAVLDPEIILRYKYLKDSPGIEKDLDNTSALEELRNDMLDRLELNRTHAVQDKKVYVFTWDCTRGGGRFYLGMGYLGKWLQPEIFKDYNPREVYQEYIDRFQGADVDVTNKGVFVYPEA